jgi:hypothetical protein
MKLPPIVVACLSALAIDSCSNVIAQRLKAWSDSKPFVFDRVLFLQFAFMVVLTAPINFHWQCWLERTFPGWKTVRQERVPSAGEEEKGMPLKDDGEDKKMVEEDVRVRDWWNIFRKWFTDCITMGALLNQSMFLLLMGFLKHKTVAMIAQDFHNVRPVTQKICSCGLTFRLGALRPHLRLVQNLANRQLLLHNILPRREAHDLPQLLWPVVEYIPLARSGSTVDTEAIPHTDNSLPMLSMPGHRGASISRQLPLRQSSAPSSKPP